MNRGFDGCAPGSGRVSRASKETYMGGNVHFNKMGSDVVIASDVLASYRTCNLNMAWPGLEAMAQRQHRCGFPTQEGRTPVGW
jgi:hypothetical protein